MVVLRALAGKEVAGPWGNGRRPGHKSATNGMRVVRSHGKQTQHSIAGSRSSQIDRPPPAKMAGHETNNHQPYAPALLPDAGATESSTQESLDG